MVAQLFSLVGWSVGRLVGDASALPALVGIAFGT